MGPSERAHRRCAKKSAVAGLYMGMVMMGIGWRGPLIQEGAVNRALTSYPYNDTQGPGARCRYKGSVVIGERDCDVFPETVTL